MDVESAVSACVLLHRLASLSMIKLTWLLMTSVLHVVLVSFYVVFLFVRHRSFVQFGLEAAQEDRLDNVEIRGEITEREDATSNWTH